jgi:ribose-phosphate pyrophosphokinase
VAAGSKERHGDNDVTISAIIGDVTGKDVIVIDDEIARGTTLVELLERLREQDVRTIRIACTHGLFADGALGKLAAQPDVAEVVCTNTVPMPAHKRDDKLKVLSIGPAMAEAIRRIHDGESVSSLFHLP